MTAPTAAATAPANGAPITVPPWLWPFIWAVPGTAGGIPGTTQPSLPGTVGGPTPNEALGTMWGSLSVGWRRAIVIALAILLILVVVRVVRG